VKATLRRISEHCQCNGNQSDQQTADHKNRAPLPATGMDEENPQLTWREK
jgi:hypothetical protein